MSPNQAGMKEDEIRPDRLKAEQELSIANDIALLNSRKDEFVTVPCPACGARDYRPKFSNYGLYYVDCEQCGTFYVNPRPGPRVLEWFYENSENYQYFNEFIFPASENVRREKIFRPRAERLADICRRYDVPMNTFLEVGAGFGIFCELIREMNLFRQVIAVEPGPSLARTCREKGLEVIEKPIEAVRMESGSVTAIASFEVIEHLFSPRDFILGCHSVLQPGGVLVLTCPNGKGFETSVLQKESTTIDWEHLNYFHPKSISGLINGCGFEVLEVTTPGKLDAELVRKKVLEGRIDLSGQPFLQETLIDRWEELGGPFQTFLADNGLSSHMWLVARKSA